MSGLVDLILPKRSATLYGVTIPITGVDAETIGVLFGRFPQLSDMAATGQFGVREILSLPNEVVAAFIAAGTGAASNEKAEAIARELPLGDKASLLAEILEMTLPRGPGPFVEACDRILRALGMVSSAPKTAGENGTSGS